MTRLVPGMTIFLLGGALLWSAPADRALAQTGGTSIGSELEFGEQLAKALGLSALQRERIGALTLAFRKEHQDALTRLEKVRQAALALAKSGRNPTPEELQALDRKHGHPAREVVPALRELREAVLAELTPEQRRRLNEMRQRMRGEPG